MPGVRNCLLNAFFLFEDYGGVTLLSIHFTSLKAKQAIEAWDDLKNGTATRLMGQKFRLCSDW